MSKRADGEGTIYYREDKALWVGQVHLDHDPETGKRRRVTVYGETQREVKERIAEARRQSSLPRTDQTVGTALLFWEGVMATRVSATTALRYRQEAAPIRERLGKLPLEEVNALTVADLYRWMSSQGHSPDAVHRTGKRVRQFLATCVQMGFIAHNPAARVPLPRVVRRDIRPLTLEQARHLLTAADGRAFRPLYHLALDTGARQGELFALTWGDLDLGGRPEVFINKSLQECRGQLAVKVPKTASGRRRVAIAQETAGVLRAAEGQRGDLVFSDSKGGHLRKSNFARNHWQPLLKAAGLEGTRFHDLRHTCATLLLIANVHPKVVSERLGHSKIDVTLNTYSHLIPSMQRDAAEALRGMGLFTPVAVPSQYGA